jgi:hypothetical protein
MIFGSKKYRINSFIFVSLLTIILTGCGGGGSEDSGPPPNNNTSSSSSPVAIASSSQATSSTPTSKSSAQATVSEPAKTNPSSSSAPSSYARSSRANDPTTDLDDYDLPPLEDNEDSIDLPPTAPKFLQVDMISADGVVISWRASTDDIGLSRYEVRRNGATIGTSIASKRSFEDTGLKANTYYTYTVRAIDITGNRSNFSEQLIAKTATLTGNGSSSISQTSSSVISHSSAISQSQSAISASSSSQTSTTSSTPSSNSENSSSSTPGSSSASFSSTTSSSSSESSSSSTPSSSSTSSKAGARVEWITPSSRENGAYLELDEIGGYEIRYRPVNSSFYLQEIITDRYATYYERTDITADAVFHIAVFDTNGLYSRFIQLTPQ